MPFTFPTIIFRYQHVCSTTPLIESSSALKKFPFVSPVNQMFSAIQNLKFKNPASLHISPWTKSLPWIDKSNPNIDAYVNRLSEPLAFDLKAKLREWHKRGTVIFDGAIAPALIDQYLEDLEHLKNHHQQYELTVELRGEHRNIETLKIIRAKNLSSTASSSTTFTRSRQRQRNLVYRKRFVFSFSMSSSRRLACFSH